MPQNAWPALLLLLPLAWGCLGQPPEPSPPPLPEPDPPKPKVEPVPAKPEDLAALPPPVLKPRPVGPGVEAEGEPLPISFDDLALGLQANRLFNFSQLTDRARELDGKLVGIQGYMQDTVAQQEGIKQFVLLRQKDCPFGIGGPADHVIMVRMVGDAKASYRTKPLTVVGTLRVRPYTGFDGNTWAVYVLEGQRVE